MKVAEDVVALLVLTSMLAAPVVLFDASRLRMSSTLAWPIVVLIMPVIGIFGYLHFRRIHVKRLEDYAAMAGTALPITPLGVVKKDIGVALFGAMLLLVALAILASERVMHLPIAIGVAGIAFVVRAARNVQSRAL